MKAAASVRALLNVRALVNRIIMVNTDMNKYTSPSTFPRRKSVRLPTSLNLLLAFARILLAYIRRAQNGKIRRAKRSVRRLSLTFQPLFGMSRNARLKEEASCDISRKGCKGDFSYPRLLLE